MENKNILKIISDALSELFRLGVCSIDETYSIRFSNVVQALDVRVGGGAYDMDTNTRWFYLD